MTRDEKMLKRRKQAVLETALARELERSDPLAALDHALVALRLVPDFVPAALIAARIQSNRGEARKSMSLLRRVWRATSHPHVATLYANAVQGASAVDRLKRIRELIDLPPPNRQAGIVLARAAVDAYEWSLARNALANYSVAEPTQSVCLLMAEIEEGQNADQGKAREWLSRAVRASADPVWTADGITADDWEPVSPVSGALDAFDWRVPLSASRSEPAPSSMPGASLRLEPNDLRSCFVARAISKRPASMAARFPAARHAALAQLVEHIIRNDGVRCSSHLSGTTLPSRQ